MAATVSVIIVLYNNAQDIPLCLDSLLSQADGSFEVIAYDNASVDGTRSLIRDQYPAVRLIEGDRNIGFAAANNYAVAAATGDVVVFLNPDTMVEPDWLPPLIHALDSDPTVGAVTPRLVFFDKPDVVNACGNEVHLSGVTYCRDLGMPSKGGRPVEIGAVSGAAFAMRRELFERLVGFETKFFTYFEDTDLSLRLRCAGFRCLVAPDSGVRHNYKAVFGADKIFYLERNRLLSLLSLLNWRLLALVFPSLLLIEFVAWGYCIKLGYRAVVAKARAWREVIRNLPWIRDRRRLWAAKCSQDAFVLRAFSPRLRIQYVGFGSSGLLRGLEIVGWVTAAPVLGMARLLERRA